MDISNEEKKIIYKKMGVNLGLKEKAQELMFKIRPFAR